MKNFRKNATHFVFLERNRYMNKLRFYFSKEPSVKYVGHLDLIEVLTPILKKTYNKNNKYNGKIRLECYRYKYG